MFDIGFLELIVVAVVALLVFGPERLPRVARDAGRWVGRARRMVSQFSSEMERQIELEDLREKLRQHGGSVDIESDVRKIEATVNDALSEALPPHTGEYEPLPRSEPDLPPVVAIISPEPAEKALASTPDAQPDERKQNS